MDIFNKKELSALYGRLNYIELLATDQVVHLLTLRDLCESSDKDQSSLTPLLNEAMNIFYLCQNDPTDLEQVHKRMLEIADRIYECVDLETEQVYARSELQSFLEHYRGDAVDKQLTAWS